MLIIADNVRSNGIIFSNRIRLVMIKIIVQFTLGLNRHVSHAARRIRLGWRFYKSTQGGQIPKARPDGVTQHTHTKPEAPRGEIFLDFGMSNEISPNRLFFILLLEKTSSPSLSDITPTPLPTHRHTHTTRSFICTKTLKTFRRKCLQKTRGLYRLRRSYDKRPNRRL